MLTGESQLEREINDSKKWDDPDFWCPLANPFDPETRGPQIHGNYKGWDIHFDSSDLEVEIYKIGTDDYGYQGTECWCWAWYQTDRGVSGPLPEFKELADHRAFLMERVKAYVDCLGY